MALCGHIGLAGHGTWLSDRWLAAPDIDVGKCGIDTYKALVWPSRNLYYAEQEIPKPLEEDVEV